MLEEMAVMAKKRGPKPDVTNAEVRRILALQHERIAKKLNRVYATTTLTTPGTLAVGLP